MIHTLKWVLVVILAIICGGVWIIVPVTFAQVATGRLETRDRCAQYGEIGKDVIVHDGRCWVRAGD